MQQKIIELNKSLKTKKMPELQSGDVVKVYRKIKEAGKERIQVFEGIIIAVKGKQSSSPLITVRKVSQGIGVELILPIYSPNIDKIELVKQAKVRRAKLYYLRGLTAKKSRMKYKELSAFIQEETEKAKEEIVDAPKEKTEEKVAEIISEETEGAKK